MAIKSTQYYLLSLLLFSLVTRGDSQSDKNVSNEIIHNEQPVTEIPEQVNDLGYERHPKRALNTQSEDENTIEDLIRQMKTKNAHTRKNSSEYSESVSLLIAYIQEHILKIDGYTYLDIGAYNASSLEIPEKLPIHTAEFDGITVVDGTQCILQALNISHGTLLSKNITKCNSLTDLTLAGNGWICRLDWTWLDKLKNVDYSKALCDDVRFVIKNRLGTTCYGFADGRQTWKESDLGLCPGRCRCFMVTNGERKLEKFRVACSGLNLTDEDVLAMYIPSQTTMLSLEGNQLRSTEKLFGHIGHLHSVTDIILKNNNLDELPYLPKGQFQNLKRLNLFDNNISKINPDAFESIVTRKDIWVALHGNDFVCDCNVHFFMKLLLLYPEKVTNSISKPLRCRAKPDEYPRLMTLNAEECEPELTGVNVSPLPFVISVLVLLNVVFVYFVWDLHRAIKECKNTGNVKDPVFHVIVKRVGKIFSEDLHRNDQPADNASPEILPEELTMIRRNHRTSAHDRRSFFRKSESRMTSGPT
ncbi:slit homolog 1 protein-like [Palaemon carinicauda]|uniref:slit homolog 1 protein-like n=1 Tax=Palaemon carinicauda TaxID=392227 RepID=UPI0035B5FE0F